MKYYSDVTKKMYDSPDECMEAERALVKTQQEEKEKKAKKEAERKIRAKEVEDARKAMNMAQSKYRETLEAFCKDYGYFHQTLTGEDAKSVVPTLFDIFNPLFFDFK